MTASEGARGRADVPQARERRRSDHDARAPEADGGASASGRTGAARSGQQVRAVLGAVVGRRSPRRRSVLPSTTNETKLSRKHSGHTMLGYGQTAQTGCIFQEEDGRR